MSPAVKTACDGRPDQLIIQGSYPIPKTKPIEVSSQGIIAIPGLPPWRNFPPVFLEWNTASCRRRLIHRCPSQASGGSDRQTPGGRDHFQVDNDGDANAKPDHRKQSRDEVNHRDRAKALDHQEEPTTTKVLDRSTNHDRGARPRSRGSHRSGSSQWVWSHKRGPWVGNHQPGWLRYQTQFWTAQRVPLRTCLMTAMVLWCETHVTSRISLRLCILET